MLKMHPRKQRNCISWMLCVLVALIATTFVGCGSGNFPVRPASGTVVCDGQSVTKGSVTFTPLGDGKALETGKAATGAIGQDGSFKLSTFGRFDGAIVGKHRVEFTGSEGDEEEVEPEDDAPVAAKQKSTQSFQGCALAQELIVEVKSSGDNVFKIELTKTKNKPR